MTLLCCTVLASQPGGRRSWAKPMCTWGSPICEDIRVLLLLLCGVSITTINRKRLRCSPKCEVLEALGSPVPSGFLFLLI
jgi:hypothetical protein